ncbi:MAG: hypothetical protein ACLQEQ_00465 [Nitrososphaerales archaeon]
MTTIVEGAEWELVAKRTRVVTLSPLLQVAIPSLLAPTLSKSTRGVSFQGGKSGLVLGAVLLFTSLDIGWLLMGSAGILGFVVLFWLVGTTGVVMMTSSLKPLAFVKPICTRCRLLPVIVEHEAIHLSGVAREADVWMSMRQRHSVESLKLEGDPAICSFCPIAKRLGER